MDKLSKVENQIKAMIQFIVVHQAGKEFVLNDVANKHGIGSDEMSEALFKYFEEINRHKIELDTLRWVLGEIENA